MGYLGKAVDGTFIACVETMHEYQQPARRRLVALIPFGHFLGRYKLFCRQGCKLARWIRRQFPWPLHLADLAFAVGRDGHHQLIEIDLVTALAAV